MSIALSPLAHKNPYAKPVGNSTVSPFTRRLADIFHRFDTLADRLVSGEKFEKADGFKYRLRKFAAMLCRWDIGAMNTFFKGRFAIPSNPIGMVLFILFPCVVGFRAFQAKRRDKTGIEIGDVLRRDITTLTMFVFLMPPIVNLINTLKQKRDGINLTAKADARDWIPQAYQYGQLSDAFDLNSAYKIEGLIAEGNGKGLVRSSQRALRMYENILGDIEGGHEPLDHYRKFLGDVIRMAEEGNQLKGNPQSPKTSALLETLSKSAYEHMTKAQESLDSMAQRLGTDTSEAGRKQWAKVAKTMKNVPKFADAFIHYGKTRRLPADLLSIAATAFLMGYAPVAFNNYLSRRRLEKMKVHHPEILQPASSRQAIYAASANPFRASALQS